VCTLTYVPTQSGFIITSNRDESIKRGKAIPPQVHAHGAVNILMPQDPDKSGTWIGVSEKGRVVVLLNGALKPHEHRPPYRMSRGLVLLDSFGFDSFERFVNEHDFKGIEPFTIIAIHRGQRVTDFRWDGSTIHRRQVQSAEPHVWTSAQMYSPSVHEATVKRFTHFLANHSQAPDSLIEFNRQETYERKIQIAGEPMFDFLRTVSISSIEVHPTEARFVYCDLTDETVHESSIAITTTP